MIDRTKIFLISTIGALICYIYVKSNFETTLKVPVIVKTKEIKGKISIVTGIIHENIKDSIVYRKGQIVYTENTINKTLAKDFKVLQKQNDSLALFKKFVDAIQIKKQTTYFNDTNISIEVESKVQGDLISLVPKYTIKPQIIKTEVEVKKPIISLYAGGGISNNTKFNNFVAQGEVGVQIKDKNIVSLTMDTRQNIGIKYLIKL
jgi:hypothetical protein